MGNVQEAEGSDGDDPEDPVALELAGLKPQVYSMPKLFREPPACVIFSGAAARRARRQEAKRMI